MKNALYFQKSFFSWDDILEIIKECIAQTQHDTFDIFCDFPLHFDHQRIKIYQEKNSNFFKNTFSLHKFLLQQKYESVLVFWENFPIFYNKNCFFLVPSLEKIWYPDLENITFLKKYSDILTQKMYLKNAQKILCFTQTSKKDLNEKLNIEEEKIEVLPWFFWKISDTIPTQIDIKNKHSLQNDYIIYDSGLGSSKNLSRLLQALKINNSTSKISLLLLWKEIANDITTRQEVIQLWLEKECIFVWNPDEKERINYYKQSLWVFFPVLYNHFPFELKNAISYNCPIFSSNGSEIQKIFWEDVTYFSPLSIQNMVEVLKNISHSQKDYSSLVKTYSIQSFVASTLKTIQSNHSL